MIRVLDKNVSNKIAAGEVVERPLSVIKELVENAIDAQASAISVDITDGGIKQMCVTDNGMGIPGNDVLLAFEKHATSKISTVNDLNHIITQGFRGEALSSIAAVSVCDMKTKTKDEDAGTHVRITGGRVDFCRPAGLPGGTSITVSNLFFNVPARLNFLKKPGQEAAYISDLISRYILAFPEISFLYRSQGKTIYHSAGNGDLKSAIYCVYGGNIMDNIALVDENYNDIRVHGYVSKPGIAMKNRRAGSIYVNRRYVRSTALLNMVTAAYGQTLVKGEFPFFAINITLAASLVDVNVHPNKLQVRFRDAAAVEHVIKEAVSSAATNIRGKVDISLPKQEHVPVQKIEMQTQESFSQPDLFTGFARSEMKESSGVYDDLQMQQAEEQWENEDFYEAQNNSPSIASPSQYRVIGSFGSTYVLVEQAENLLMIDQHAAHERLLYDKFISETEAVSQSLLAPQIITVSHEQKNLIDDNIEVFNKLGFEISPFGALEYQISALPSVLPDVSAEELIAEVLGDIKNPVLRREDLIRLACRRAVKAGDKLNDIELGSLVDSFLQSDVFPTCPHGRPIITVITKKQIEKSFKRTV